jgi:hypothetical protein
MTELLSVLCEEAAAAGHNVCFAFDEFPVPLDDDVYVVVPHEFQAWCATGAFPNARQRARTIALCTENAGTEWFDATRRLVPEFAAALSINRSSAAELRRGGVPCEHLQLGYASSWDSWRGDPDVARDIDVLYLGAADPRRDPLLGACGSRLWARECQFLVPPLEPRTGPRPDFLEGADKYQRLRSARILLNLHRTSSAALEWMRVLETICNGCVVVSEPSLDSDPLIPDEHFVVADIAHIADTVDRLLDEPERISSLRARAYEFVRGQLPMRPAVERLAEVAAGLPSASFADRHVAGISKPRASPRHDGRAQASSIPGVHASDRRMTGVLSSAARRRRRGARLIARSAAHASTAPTVTVAVVRSREYDPAGLLRTLRSVAASRYRELELLELDHDALADRVRGEHLLVLDAGTEIYPSTVERLVRALDDDPRATFAYPMVVGFDGDRPARLLSSLPWEPERLRSGNWIDTLALVRTKHLRELGGYTRDPRLTGWEDFDLWCRCADRGGHGLLVPQVLGARQRPEPLDAEMDASAKWTLMRTLFPQLLETSSAA